MLEGLELSAQRGETLIFAGVSFTLRAGTALVVTGANGSGKTTLLRIAAGLSTAQTGELFWNSTPVTSFDARLREATLYVGHATGLKDELDARENLQSLLSLHGTPCTPQTLDAALQTVSLEGASDRPVRYLSQGQRRRIGLARLLLSARPLWVLDEPATALDAAGIAQLESMLERHLAAKGMAMISTHQPLALSPERVSVMTL